MINLNTAWADATIIGFDTETSGKYPLESEICEIAAVKWCGGKIVDEFQSLVAVSRPMSDEVINIHHITNEMVAKAPTVPEVIKKFHEFIKGGVVVAHHAPFDLGFVAHEFDKAGLPLPEEPVFCSSILSRRAFPQAPNHRLQTLIPFFKLQQGAAHRALDDARACLEVTLRVFQKVSEKVNQKNSSEVVSLQSLFEFQTTDLQWAQFSTKTLRKNAVFATLVKAIETRQDVQIVYDGGSRPGQARTVKPIGLVRTPIERAAIINAEGGGDFFVAQEEGESIPKRYFLKKISAARF